MTGAQALSVNRGYVVNRANANQLNNAGRRKVTASPPRSPVGVNLVSTMIYAHSTVRLFGGTVSDCTAHDAGGRE